MRVNHHELKAKYEELLKEALQLRDLELAAMAARQLSLYPKTLGRRTSK